MEEGGLASVIEFHAERGLELSEVPQLLERAPGHRRPDVLHVEGKVGELDDGAVGQDKAVALQGIGGEPMGPAEARVHVPGYPCSSTHHERLEFDGVDGGGVDLVGHGPRFVTEERHADNRARSRPRRRSCCKVQSRSFAQYCNT